MVKRPFRVTNGAARPASGGAWPRRATRPAPVNTAGPSPAARQTVAFHYSRECLEKPFGARLGHALLRLLSPLSCQAPGSGASCLPTVRRPRLAQPARLRALPDIRAERIGALASLADKGEL